MAQHQVHLRITAEDGAFWATVEEMPGVFATGDTLQELHDSLVEGIALWLAKPDEPTPDITLGEFDPQVEPVERIATAELTYA